MRINFFLSCFTIFVFTNCNIVSSKYKKIVIQDLLEVNVPSRFNFSEKKGIDSYSFEITDSTYKIPIVIYGDMGLYVNNLSEIRWPVFSLSKKDSLMKINDTSILNMAYFSETPIEDFDLNIFGKQFYCYDTINGIATKIIQPKRNQIGITGIYIPKLKNGISLSLYSENLNLEAHKEVMSIFKSIKYVKN